MDSSGTTGSVNVTVVDSVVFNNGNFGINATSGHTQAMVRNSIVSYSFIGLFAVGAAIIRVGHLVVTWNIVGVSATSGGTIFSYGDNDIDGNTTDNTAGLTTIPTH